MPYIDHQSLVGIAIVLTLGLVCIYCLRVAIIAIRHHRLRSKLRLKQSELIALSAEVNRLSQDDSHWKQLYEEVSPLDSQGVARWLESMRSNA